MRPLISILILIAANVQLAQACMCIRRYDFLAPANGAVDVPADALIWVGSARFGNLSVEELAAAREAIVLQGDGGEQVRGNQSRVSERSQRDERFIQVLKPEAPLQAGATYTVHVHGELVSRFTVAKNPVQSRVPDVPVVTREVTVVWPEDVCGGVVGKSFVLGGKPAIAVAEIVGVTQLFPALYRGEVAELSNNGLLQLSHGACSRNLPWQTLWRDLEVRYGAFDVAGHFSGWSSPRPMHVPISAWVGAFGSRFLAGAICLILAGSGLFVWLLRRR